MEPPEENNIKDVSELEEIIRRWESGIYNYETFLKHDDHRCSLVIILAYAILRPSDPPPSIWLIEEAARGILDGKNNHKRPEEVYAWWYYRGLPEPIDNMSRTNQDRARENIEPLEDPKNVGPESCTLWEELFGSDEEFDSEANVTRQPSTGSLPSVEQEDSIKVRIHVAGRLLDCEIHSDDMSDEARSLRRAPGHKEPSESLRNAFVRQNNQLQHESTTMPALYSSDMPVAPVASMTLAIPKSHKPLVSSKLSNVSTYDNSSTAEGRVGSSPNTEIDRARVHPLPAHNNEDGQEASLTNPKRKRMVASQNIAEESRASYTKETAILGSRVALLPPFKPGLDRSNEKSSQKRTDAPPQSQEFGLLNNVSASDIPHTLYPVQTPDSSVVEQDLSSQKVRQLSKRIRPKSQNNNQPASAQSLSPKSYGRQMLAEFATNGLPGDKTISSPVLHSVAKASQSIGGFAARGPSKNTKENTRVELSAKQAKNFIIPKRKPASPPIAPSGAISDGLSPSKGLTAQSSGSDSPNSNKSHITKQRGSPQVGITGYTGTANRAPPRNATIRKGSPKKEAEKK